MAPDLRRHKGHVIDCQLSTKEVLSLTDGMMRICSKRLFKCTRENAVATPVARQAYLRLSMLVRRSIKASSN